MIMLIRVVFGTFVSLGTFYNRYPYAFSTPTCTRPLPVSTIHIPTTLFAILIVTIALPARNPNFLVLNFTQPTPFTSNH